MKPTEHLDDWTLEHLAEGELSGVELEGAAAHLEGCGRCTAELEGYRALYAALAAAPRFAPSPGFADAVMARVEVAQPSRVWAFIERLIPKTRRGRFFLAAAATAPGIPVLLGLIWLFTRPGLNLATAGQMVSDVARDVASTGLATVVRLGLESGVFGAIGRVTDSLAAVPIETLAGAAGALAVAIPLSAWALYRLIRTPTRNASYAN